jgi:mono/diheme cytochrome c family protein
MASVGRWIKRVVGVIAIVIIIAAIAIYAMSSAEISRHYAARTVPIGRLTDSASLARGEHLARLSCFGCHRDSLQGGAFFDVPMVARISAPNVMVKLASYNDSALAGFLRYGVRPDGTSPFVMPPPGLYHLSDADLASLIGYLRSRPTAATPALLPNSFRPMGRLGVVLGQFKTAVHAIDTTVARVGADPASATTRRGEYLARVICVECHGPALTGSPGPPAPTPSLAGAVGYSTADFITLLRTGTPRTPDRRLTLMAEVAKGNLTHLADDEIAALYEYLKALPQTGVPGIRK